jgi:hypothetical protein
MFSLIAFVVVLILIYIVFGIFCGFTFKCLRSDDSKNQPNPPTPAPTPTPSPTQNPAPANLNTDDSTPVNIKTTLYSLEDVLEEKNRNFLGLFKTNDN